MITSAPSYRGYRFPPDIIAHAVWLYFRFSLSFRDVEDLLAQRGVTVTYETVRRWCRTFGRAYARRLRHHRGRLGDTWYLDELFVTLNGRPQYLWRAVDEDGDLLDVLVQSRRNRHAAVRFFRKLLKRQGCVPRRLIRRQAPQLPSGAPRGDAVGRPRHGPVCKQSGGGLSPTDAPAGTPDAAVQVSCAPATLCHRARRGAESLSRRPASAAGRASSPAPHARVCGMGCGDVCLLTQRGSASRGEPRAAFVKLTTPPQGLSETVV